MAETNIKTSNKAEAEKATAYSSADIWRQMCDEAQKASQQQPLMASFFTNNILNHDDFASAISFYLSSHLDTDTVPAMLIRDVFLEAIADDVSIEQKMQQDLLAHYQRDPACDQYITPLLFFKGYHAVQSYRIAHWLWQQNRRLLAYYLQSRVSQLFDVDIHPAAKIGGGLMIDHATGVVIGEMSVIGDNVSMLHAVTLGGSGSQGGDRHPKVGSGVLLSAGAKLLGNINVGECAKIGAGSLVLSDVPAHATAVGVPAKVVGISGDTPALSMDHSVETEIIEEHVDE